MKKYISMILISLMMFVGNNVKALTATEEKPRLYDSNETYDEEKMTWFHYKTIDSSPAYCLNRLKKTPVNSSLTAAEGYSGKRKNISAIIAAGNKITENQKPSTFKEYNTETGESKEGSLLSYQYFVTSLALDRYLNQNEEPTVTGDTLKLIKTLANVSAPESPSDITISSNSNTTQNLGNDNIESGYVKSKLITIKLNQNIEFKVNTSGATGIKIYNESNSDVTENPTFTTEGKFYILVPVGQIDSNSSKKITYTIEASKKFTQYKSAMIYTTGNSAMQDLAVYGGTEDVTKELNEQYSLTIDLDTYIDVTKKDKSTNKAISGAKLQLVKSNGQTIGCTISNTSDPDDGTYSENCSWTTTNSEKYILGLVAGNYKLKELKSPSGYQLVETLQDVTVTKGTSTSITFFNQKNKITFSKKDATGKNELPGATLHVLDKDKKSMSCTILKDGKEQKLDKCTWVSGTKSVEIVGLKAGKYYLKETIAPNRYVLSEELVSFEVKEDKEVTNVEMTNKLNKVVISKINAFTKKELPGATLEIQNEKGEIVKYCLEQEKNPECKWVSTEEPFVIEGLPNGTYYLVETIAPKGFVLNKEKVKFTVDGKTAISYVQMENELEVEVPDTLSSRSVLLVAISMFDIALGIGIISYVKKNKYQE